MASSDSDVSLKVLMKCENLQKVGGKYIHSQIHSVVLPELPKTAFKIRGATNAVVSLLEDMKSEEEKKRLSVITHSSGNHAQALALASQELGVSCQVVMPSNSASVKKSAVRGYGATVTECVPTLQAREDGVKEIMDRMRSEGQDIVLIPPYDDVRIIAGQGTLALEFIEQAKESGDELDVLITPVGGVACSQAVLLLQKASTPESGSLEPSQQRQTMHTGHSSRRLLSLLSTPTLSPMAFELHLAI